MRLARLLCISIATVLVACSGSDGKDGAQGPEGPAGPGADGGAGVASISAVVPATAFLGGSATVTISGNATDWSDQAQPDFGAGVTVKSVAIASPTAIVADIDVDFDAAVGPRDVTVTDGGSSLAYKSAFRVMPPTSVDAQGTVAQGSVVLAKIRDLDFSRPFDTTQAGDGLFTPITYPNITLSTDTGIAAQLNGAQAYALDALILIDADVPAGATKVDVLSGPVGARTSFANPTGLDVQARTPEAINTGTDKTFTVDKPYASGFYTFTPGSGLRIVEVNAKASDTNANPQVFLIGASGHFGDAMGFASNVGFATDAAPKLHVVYWDNSGTSGYDATVRADEFPATGGAESEPNDTSGTAKTISLLPFVIQGATLSDGNDQDWFQISVPAGSVGKRVHVRTFGSDSLTDTVVEVFAGDGTTSLGGPSGDAGYHENWYSDTIPSAGTYYVEISASSFFDPTHSAYDAYIRIE